MTRIRDLPDPIFIIEGWDGRTIGDSGSLIITGVEGVVL